jgi:Domain of unknown function (DUF4386)
MNKHFFLTALCALLTAGRRSQRVAHVTPMASWVWAAPCWNKKDFEGAIVTMVAALFGPFYVRASLFVAGDAAATAVQIQAAQTLFRVGILSDLLTSVGCVVLACALHELLCSVSRRLATLALAWRTLEVSPLSASALCGLGVLALLRQSGPGKYAVFGERRSGRQQTKSAAQPHQCSLFDAARAA